MTILTNGTWAGGCVHTIIKDTPDKPDGPTVAAWLHALDFNEFCDALQAMIDDGSMGKDKADKTYNAYVNKHEED